MSRTKMDDSTSSHSTNKNAITTRRERQVLGSLAHNTIQFLEFIEPYSN